MSTAVIITEGCPPSVLLSEIPQPAIILETATPGRPGLGVPVGGSANQFLRKSSANAPVWASATKADVGLPNVDNTADTTKPVSSPTREYIGSRGPGLITNGTGLLKSNYNFPGTVFNMEDRPIGSIGSFRVTNAGTVETTEDIAVDPYAEYQISFWARQVHDAGGSKRVYVGVRNFDAYGYEILSRFFMEQPGTRTTLAEDLKPGDTQIVLTDGSNWNNTLPAGTHLRSIIIWNYVDPTGHLWLPGEYSRNWVQDLWEPGTLNGNVVPLKSPWPGSFVAAGTSVSNGSSTGTSYTHGPATLSPDWTYFPPERIHGVAGGNVGYNAYSAFAPATTRIRLTLFCNYGDGWTLGGIQGFAGFSMEKLPSALTHKVQPGAFAINKTMLGRDMYVNGNVTLPNSAIQQAAMVFPINGWVRIINSTANNLLIGSAGDLLRHAGTTNTGNYAIPPYGVVMLRKITATEWLVSPN